MHPTDLIIHNARLADGRLVTVRIEQGLIASIEAVPPGGGTSANAPPTPAANGSATLDAEGDLLLPALVEGHTHLDKTWFGLPWMENETGFGVAERAAYEREVEARIAYPTLVRAGRLIEQMVANGSTRIRTHVDITPTEGLTRLEGVLEARDKYRDVAEVQVVAFPQLGVMPHPDMVDRLDAALRAGADVLGGIDPATIDGDITGQLDAMFALAQRHDVGLDFHLHTSGSLGIHELEQVALRSKACGMQGRVVASHAHGLGSSSPDVQRATAERLAQAGVAVCTYAPGWVNLPPLKLLSAAGVTVFAGSDNVRDAWVPYGTGDMLERAWIVAYRSGFRRDSEFGFAFEMCSRLGALGCGFGSHELAPGCQADLMLVAAENIPDAVCRRPPRHYVIRRGRIVARQGHFVGLDEPAS
jgi:cytosine deaminase